MLMLAVGFGFYYFSDREPADGPLLIEQSEYLQGQFDGLSEQNKGVNARRILLIKVDDNDQRRVRITYQQAAEVRELSKGSQIEVWTAPRVSGSTRRWVYRLVSGDQLILDDTPESDQ